MGFVYAIHPCDAEFHFGFQGQWLANAAGCGMGKTSATNASNAALPEGLYLAVCLTAPPQRFAALLTGAGLESPPLLLPALGIAITSRLDVFSVSNNGAMDSTSDAIGIEEMFWVGKSAMESRSISRGHLYLAGALVIQDLPSALKSPVKLALEGVGKVRPVAGGRSWFGRLIVVATAPPCRGGGTLVPDWCCPDFPQPTFDAPPSPLSNTDFGVLGP